MAAADQSPSGPMPEPALLALARENFGPISRAEEEFFRAAQDGRAASALDVDEKENDLANAANWKADRVVRAECISWVCTDRRASSFMTYRGLELWGMRIDGLVDLDNAEINFSLRAWKCAFSENISLQDAQLRGFYFVACQIRSLDAGRAIIKGSVLLRGEGFKAVGEVNLMATTIGGDLDCDSAQFSNAEGLALNADGAKIAGNVSLRKNFKALGEINLVAATIGSNLQCDGAQLSNASGWGLNASAAKIEGSVFLRDGFTSRGGANLLSARIGGNLNCVSAQLSSSSKSALNASGAKIVGNIFLCDGFKAEGEVYLVGATIGGDLNCRSAQFSNGNGVALSAERSRIERAAFLIQGFRAEGEVNLAAATIDSLQIREVSDSGKMILNLRHARVETFWDDEASWPNGKNLFLDGFRYERLFEQAPFEAESRKKWLNLQTRDRFRPQPYEQLAAVLRQMGHEPEARQIMIEKNRERAGFTHFPHQSWWWYNLIGKFIGYGYRPWRAFAMSVAMILLGTFLFHFGSKHHLISATGDKAYAKAPNGQVIEQNGRPRISKQYPVFKSFVYSLESFTPLLKLDQSANWAPNANLGTEIPLSHFWVTRTGSLLRYYLYFHIAAGWLLTSLWVGAITGLVKT